MLCLSGFKLPSPWVPLNIGMSTCALTVQLGILTLCVNYWVWNLTYQRFTFQPGFNYTIQNTTLLPRCKCKLLDVKSYSLFPAKVYFLIKWTVDDSPHWIQVDWVQTDRHFKVALFKPSPLGYLFVLFTYTRVVRYVFCFIQLTS